MARSSSADSITDALGSLAPVRSEDMSAMTKLTVGTFYPSFV